MTTPISIPIQQFLDANGAPLAAGTIDVFEPGTSARKTTWKDKAQTVENSNPVILDSSGRCILWGSGDYRLVLKDATGNLVFDQVATAPG